MRLPSLRPASSHRRKLAAVLVLLTPAVGWCQEHGNRLRIPDSAAEPLRPGTPSIQPATAPALAAPALAAPALAAPALAAPALASKSVQHTVLVPLSVELSGPAGGPIPLIGPISGAIDPLPAHLQNLPPVEDGWLPRRTVAGSRATLIGPAGKGLTDRGPAAPQSAMPVPIRSPLPAIGAIKAGAPIRSTVQILPSQFSELETAEALRDSQTGELAVQAGGEEAREQPAEFEPSAVQAVTDPEQNEPAEAEMPAADDEGQLEAIAVVELPADPEASAADEQRSVEIRRFQLRDEAQAARESSGTAARAVSNRSARRVTVGDMSPDGEDVSPEADRGRNVTPTETAAAPAIGTNPIRGDRITAAGELILASGVSASGLPVLPQTAQLKPTIERGLRYYWDNPEDAAERTYWGMMHSIMVFDKDTQIVNRRQRYNAVAWMAGNNPCRNQLLFSRDQHGIVVRTGVGLQGHQAQLLAIFGLINVPLHYPVYAARQKFSVADILDREMLDCKSGNELTFTLIALAHYADSDTAWVSLDQQDWDVQRVIREELSQPIVGAACGGTHRLMGFAHALRRRRAEGKPIVDQWDRADRYVAEFVDYTWTLQNRDGSMSTAWFERSEDNDKTDRKIQTTGHMLEVLLSTVPDAQLQSPKMIRAVGYLANTLYAERGHQWQIGPKGHALRALAMYYQRVFGDSAPWRSESGEQSASAGAAPRRAVR